MQSSILTAPNWKPLESAVPECWLPDYMHMGEHGTIQLYKRRDNRLYLNIDTDCMRFYQHRDGSYIEVSRATAILGSLGISNWDIPLSAIAHAPARFRAASVLTAFFAFQRNVNNEIVGYRPQELCAVVSVLSRVGYGLENFAEMCTAELENADCERSLKHEVRLLVSMIGSVAVPAVWLPNEEGTTPSHNQAGRLWQEFCLRLAAEAEVEPVYGIAIKEPASTPRPFLQPSHQLCTTVEPRKSGWGSCLQFLRTRGGR